MKKPAFLVMFTLLFCFHVYTHACTGMKVRTSEGILVGANEDYNSTYRDVIARIRPPARGEYGYIGTGFEQHEYFMMGINDQGLFLDMYTVPACFTWVPDSTKMYYDGFVEGELIRQCANVDEAIDFFDQYNFPSMGTYPYQIFVADSSGASAIISYTENGIEVIRSQDDYQVVTNFFINYPSCGYYPCWRYNHATNTLENAESYSFELVHDILEHVTLSSNFSQIANLNNGDITIFYNHNFDEYIKFNFYEEIAHSRRDYFISDYCCELNLLEPGNQSTVPESTSAVLEWEGVAYAAYQVYLSEDPDFLNCEPIYITEGIVAASVISKALIFPFIILSLIMVFFRKKNRNSWFFIFLLLSVIYVCCVCEKNSSPLDQEQDRSIKSYTKTVTDLNPGTTYYWKIQARITGSVYSESTVNSFTTSVN